MGFSRRYLVGGRVQGVGFRYFVEGAATREGLHGWVRNLPDGRVEIVVEGDADELERFERQVRQGPPGARVNDVQIDEMVSGHRETGFRIR
jgi:acylphosphatase